MKPIYKKFKYMVEVSSSEVAALEKLSLKFFTIHRFQHIWHKKTNGTKIGRQNQKRELPPILLFLIRLVCINIFNLASYRGILLILLWFTHLIRSEMDKGNLLGMLDVQIAFDTVNHKILLSILKACGIGSSGIKWFTAY